MKKYNLISFSGIDSSGKSTYIKHLVDEFERQRIKYKVVWSRGGYTSGFEILKKLLRIILGNRLPQPGISEKRTKMFSSNKVSNVWFVIAMIDLIRLYAITFRIYKIFGYTIICDRYIWDTYVDFNFDYQDMLSEKLWKFLEKTYCRPDLSLYFYVSPEESLRRSETKNEPFSETLERRVKRMQIYSRLMDEGKWSVCYSTENNSIDDVKDRIRVLFEDITS